MTNQEPAPIETHEDAVRPKLTRGLELLASMLLALMAFVVVLWLLHLGFPLATDIGEALRRRDFDGSSPGPVRVRIDGAEGQPFVAVLSDIHRDVKDKPAYAVSWSDAQDGRELEERHAIQSFDRSGALIEFDSGNTISLGENSLIIVRKLRDDRTRKTRRAALTIIGGSLQGRVSPGTESPVDLEIQAPGGSIRARSSEAIPADFNVTTAPDGSTTLAVYEGRAEIQFGSKSTIVPANHAVVFSESKPPGSLQPLPAPPIISSPHDDDIYTYRDAPPRVEFAWDTRDRTSRFRYRIARDREFNDVVHDEILSGRRFTHGNLEAGTYYWQVNGVQESIEGAASRTQRVQLVLDREAPPLRVDVPERVKGRQVLLRGTTEPGSVVLVDDKLASVSDAGTFEFAVELRNGYNVVVLQAIDHAGNTSFKSGLINAEY